MLQCGGTRRCFGAAYLRCVELSFELRDAVLSGCPSQGAVFCGEQMQLQRQRMNHSVGAIATKRLFKSRQTKGINSGVIEHGVTPCINELPP
ncbi:hypothetical protein AX767_07435 [Variovorax sp. PAMC 28711]|nr:hypothetical protein AX767_07435 [Variovorax sp. PAMC 28711]